MHMQVRALILALQVGGVLGLFMGFSIISLIEILYWICVGVGEWYVRKSRKKSGVITVQVSAQGQRRALKSVRS